jgi:hypothetical protein
MSQSHVGLYASVASDRAALVRWQHFVWRVVSLSRSILAREVILHYSNFVKQYR